MTETIINEPGNVQGMPPVREIKEGSVVRLKSGGPLMTVGDIIAGRVNAGWFIPTLAGYEPRFIENVPVASLELDESEDPKVKEIREYLIQDMDSFEHDPADSEFLEGYESAVCTIYGDLFLTEEERAELATHDRAKPEITPKTSGTLGHLDLSQPDAPRSESNNNGQAASGTSGTVGTPGWWYSDATILAIVIIACLAIGAGLLR